jgi:hypothetical protein
MTERYPHRVISLFAGDGRGALRRAAAMTGVPVTTIHSWLVAGRIPAKRHRQLFAAARRHGIPLKPEHFFDLEAEEQTEAAA